MEVEETVQELEQEHRIHRYQFLERSIHDNTSSLLLPGADYIREPLWFDKSRLERMLPGIHRFRHKGYRTIGLDQIPCRDREHLLQG